MPDYGCPAVDLERNLEASFAICPALDHGSSLLQGFPTHSPSGGRQVSGGIMLRSGYRGPTVNIRPPKWTDCILWVKAGNMMEAKFIADAVYYYTGRVPFHFLDANFSYPPLRLGTRTLLTREECAAYVDSIAKGPASLKQREDYNRVVKDLVLKAVRSPEAALFLRSLRPVPRSGTNVEATDDGEVAEDESHSAGLPAVEAASNVDDVESMQQGTPMEVDHLSAQAAQSLVRGPETVEPSRGLAYVASFGFDWFDSENILRSDSQSLDAGFSRFGGKAEEHSIPSNIEGLLRTLDKAEDEGWRSMEIPDWLRPQPNISYHTPRYRRVLPSPDPDREAL